MTTETLMEEYHRKRAPEHERTYGERGRLKRQEDLATLKEWLLKSGKTVLEIAAGTSYWTAVAVPIAKSNTATDRNRETLELCAPKQLTKRSGEFTLSDKQNAHSS